MRISVVIPNWNGAKHLPGCLAALRRQTLAPTQVILVDNASADDSLALVARDFPEVTVIALPENRLFTGACNAGIHAATGAAIALLNNDTEADANWLARVAACFEAHPDAGIVATKLRLFDKRDHLHSAGDYYSARGIPGNRGVWQRDDGRFDQPYVFGACGAASVLRRDMLDQIGVLDDALQFSCEDIDLAWRAQLAGFRCAFAHDAIVYHKVSATGGGIINSYYDGRNCIWVLVKDVPGEILRANWRRMLGAQLAITRDALKAWRGAAARNRLKGQLAGVLGIPRMLRARKQVQATRVLSREAVLGLLSEG
jgi:GT2 family glycosyltransferase